jgi:hypothetical protein
MPSQYHRNHKPNAADFLVTKFHELKINKHRIWFSLLMHLLSKECSITIKDQHSLTLTLSLLAKSNCFASTVLSASSTTSVTSFCANFN